MVVVTMMMQQLEEDERKKRETGESKNVPTSKGQVEESKTD